MKPVVQPINGVGVQSVYVLGTSQSELQGIGVSTDLNPLMFMGVDWVNAQNQKHINYKPTQQEREQLIANAKTGGVDDNNNNTNVDDKIAPLLDEVKADGAPYDKPSFESPCIIPFTAQFKY